MMTPQATARTKVILLTLLGLGFAGLIGAHEVAVMVPSPADEPSTTLPLVLAAIGTLCFVAAGLIARKLMKAGASK